MFPIVVQYALSSIVYIIQWALNQHFQGGGEVRDQPSIFFA